MAEKTQKELLISLIKMQSKQGNDLVEIKTCLLGDEYHPEGLVHQTTKNTDCINAIKRKTIPDLEIGFERRAGTIEKSIERKSGIIGGAVAFAIAILTTFANMIIGK